MCCRPAVLLTPLQDTLASVLFLALSPEGCTPLQKSEAQVAHFLTPAHSLRKYRGWHQERRQPLHLYFQSGAHPLCFQAHTHSLAEKGGWHQERVSWTRGQEDGGGEGSIRVIRAGASEQLESETKGLLVKRVLKRVTVDNSCARPPFVLGRLHTHDRTSCPAPHRLDAHAGGTDVFRRSRLRQPRLRQIREQYLKPCSTTLLLTAMHGAGTGWTEIPSQPSAHGRPRGYALNA